MPYSGFWSAVLKDHFWKQCRSICLIPKFSAKIKTPKFGYKNPWLGNFWPGIWKSDIQFVISKTLSYCFFETIAFDVKASFARPPVSRLIKPGNIRKEF